MKKAFEKLKKKYRTSESYQWALVFWISIPLVVFSFVSSSFFFQYLRTSAVTDEGQKSAESLMAPQSNEGGLDSIFRLPGQEREEYITEKELKTQNLSYEEQLVYLEEYNRKKREAKIKYYTDENGEKVFAGYISGKINPSRLPRRTYSRSPGYRNVVSKGFYSSAPKTQTRVQRFLQSQQEPTEMQGDSTEIETQIMTEKEIEKPIINKVSDETTPATQVFVQETVSPVIQQEELISKAPIKIQETTRPSIKLSYYGSDYIEDDIYKVIFFFSESVYDFISEDIHMTNGEILSFTQRDRKTFSMNVEHKDRTRTLKIFVPEGVARDRYGNTNMASNPLEITLNKKPSIKVRVL